MGLSNINEKRIRTESSRLIWHNEMETISKIANLQGVPDNHFVRLNNLISYTGSRNTKGNTDIAVTGNILKNSNGKKISAYVPAKNESDNIIVLSYDLDEETRAAITRDSLGEITYTLISPETGSIDLAKVNASNLKLYNWGTQKDREIGRLFSGDPEFLDISSEKVEGNTLRDIIANNIADHPLMGKYSERIVSAFDQILSLDDERNIESLSDEQISRIELLRKLKTKDEELVGERLDNREKDKKISELLKEKKILEDNSDFDKEYLDAKDRKITDLQRKVEELREELARSEKTNMSLSDLISKIKATVSKIPFFGKKALRDIGITEKQLPEAHEIPKRTDTTFRDSIAIDSENLVKSSNYANEKGMAVREDIRE